MDLGTLDDWRGADTAHVKPTIRVSTKPLLNFIVHSVHYNLYASTVLYSSRITAPHSDHHIKHPRHTNTLEYFLGGMS